MLIFLKENKEKISKYICWAVLFIFIIYMCSVFVEEIDKNALFLASMSEEKKEQKEEKEEQKEEQKEEKEEQKEEQKEEKEEQKEEQKEEKEEQKEEQKEEKEEQKEEQKEEKEEVVSGGSSSLNITTPITEVPEFDSEIPINSSAPYVCKVFSPILFGSFKSGIVPIIVLFNEEVVVIGKPQLIISTGEPFTTIATYKSHYKNLIFFQYRISPGNFTSKLDYASSSALVLNGGQIKDKDGNNAILTLPEPGSLGSLSTSSHIVINAKK